MSEDGGDEVIRPAWVRLGLWGIRSRWLAWAFVWLSAVLASLIPFFPLGTLFAIVAGIYLAGIGWMDRHAAWDRVGDRGPRRVPEWVPWGALGAVFIFTLPVAPCVGNSSACTGSDVGLAAYSFAFVVLLISLGVAAVFWLRSADRNGPRAPGR